MSREIIEAVRTIEREKGIESDTLVHALEDALLAAYKKTPGASRHASVELDDGGDFRVYSIELPKDIEERLIDEARERGARAPRGRERRALAHAHQRRRPRHRLVGRRPGAREARGRHAARFRADRGADRQAGDPAAHSGGRAGDAVRRVRRPRRRG